MEQRKRQAVLFLILVGALSYFNLFRGYQEPPRLFWDENYHIASAQKYLHGVFFQEPHPPLGKLLIALGELWLEPNAASDQFLDTMHGTGDQLPSDFSFKGYRFFPALLAALTGPVLYGIGLLLFGSPLAAFILSLLFIFDNALVVHLRGAMLEGPQLFFVMLAVLFYLFLRRAGTLPGRFFSAIAFGAACGCAVTTKVTSLILAILFIDLLFRERAKFLRALGVCLVAFAAFFFVVLGVWQTHYSLGREIRAKLPDNGYFWLNEGTRGLVSSEQGRELKFFPVWFIESMLFVDRYTRGVPKLNLCKSEENGSPPFFWPLGARSINYLWATNDGKTRYLYLQVNPIGWFIGLSGVLLSLLVFGARSIYPETKPLTRGADIRLFLSMYLGYMAAMCFIGRVMYLYHYFIPLIFSFILFVLSAKEIDRFAGLELTERRKKLLGCALATAVIAVFIVYSPLTYYRPVTKSWMKQRALLSLWDLRCPKCGLINGIAHPVNTEPDPPKDFSLLTLDGTSPLSGQQEWGSPNVGRTADGRPLSFGGQLHPEGFGVHAKTVLMYPLGGNYRRFTALVGIPDAANEENQRKGSVVFEFFADADLILRTNVIRGGEPPIPVDIPLSGRKTLKLLVADSGDGNSDDHAAFAHPTLEREVAE